MIALGKVGNEDSNVFCFKKVTSIVSIVVGLDGFFLLQDHHLPGFKFEGYRPVEMFTGESADESESLFHVFGTTPEARTAQTEPTANQGLCGMGFVGSAQEAITALLRHR
jgi:hypothetical protein